MKTSLQLYSLRNEVKGDLIGLLKKVREIGYDGVEFAGFFDCSAVELKKALHDLNLVSVVSHTGFDDLKNNLQKTLEFNAEIGTKFIVLPYANLKSEGDYLAIAEFCAHCAEETKKFGMGFGYHNHDFEFRDKFNGRTGMEIILSGSDQINAQFDVYWITHAGMNPVDFVEKYKGRVPVLHLKDGDKSFEQTEIGLGIVDIAGCIKAGLKCGTEWFTVEQDDIKIDPFESVKISLENISNK